MRGRRCWRCWTDLLKPEDEAALLVFNHASRVLLGLDHGSRPAAGGAGRACKPTGGTAIYDAIDIALPLFEDRRNPRAAIILVSDGADTASDTTVIELKQRLGRGDIFLYGVAVDTPNARRRQRINPQVFRELSAQSGGYAEVVASTADIGPATSRIAEELNAQYMIGYTPTTPGDGRRTGRSGCRRGRQRSSTSAPVVAWSARVKCGVH